MTDVATLFMKRPRIVLREWSNMGHVVMYKFEPVITSSGTLLLSVSNLNTEHSIPKIVSDLYCGILPCALVQIVSGVRHFDTFNI